MEGAKGGSNWKFRGKTSQVHLIIIREWPKNSSPPILGNLDNFPIGAFSATPPPPTIRHERVVKGMVTTRVV